MKLPGKIGTTKLSFIVDTGAAVSIIPQKYLSGVNPEPTPISLHTATGSQIPCAGEARLNLEIPLLRRNFSFNFIVAETNVPLLGLDFLSYHGIVVDCQARTIVDRSTSVKAVVSCSSTINNLVVNNFDVQNSVRNILEKYPGVTSPNPSRQIDDNTVYHRIDTGSAPPVYNKPRQLSTEKLEVVKTEFRKLQDSGVIRPSMSPWASPLHLVKKSNNSYRPCGDYRALNILSKPDRYPVPNINSLSSFLNKKNIFSKIDLLSAYHQIPVHPDDIAKTAITTPIGLFEYVYMPFGLRNSSSTFQRYMDQIFRNLDFVFIYLDDILVHSDNLSQHLEHLDKVFDVLERHGLRISIKKCEFLKETIDFLGYNLNPRGIKPTSSKTEELLKFPYPSDSSSLRRYLGMTGFYRKLVPDYATIVFPLTERIKNEPKSKSLSLSDAEKSAVDKIRGILVNLAPLPYPDSDVSEYLLVTDASNYAIGAALHQVVKGVPVPIGFYSKKLTDAQKKYSVFDRELLAAYYSVLHFKHNIEGRIVKLMSDHKPLVSAFKSSNVSKSDRQQRHLSLVAEYVSDMAYIKGEDNIVADCMSRPAFAVTLDLCDLPQIAVEQDEDQELPEYKENLSKYELYNGKTIYCDNSTNFPRPFIPLSLRKAVFDSYHNLSHPGVKGSVKLIKSRFYWPNIDKDIRNWTRECTACQKSKVHRHTRSKLEPINIPSERFQTVHIDIVGPLSVAHALDDSHIIPYRYILTCIDRSTKWIEATPLTDIAAKSVATAFLNCWVSRFGVPLHVVTDRGSQFESELFNELSRLVGFHRLRTSSYHPQTNGMIERQHRTLKSAIIARGDSWLIALPIVLMSLRAIPNDSEFSPFTAVTGTNMLLPRTLIYDTNEKFSSLEIKKLCQEMSKVQLDSAPKMKAKLLTGYIPKDLSSCKFVWLRTDRVRKSLEAPYSGPYKVLRRSPKNFAIEINDKPNTVSIDRLKPAHLPDENASAVPEKTITTRSGRKVRFRGHDDTIYY